MEKKRDDNYSYRRCYILLLEEWDETQFKIVDYMNFDWGVNVSNFKNIYNLNFRLINAILNIIDW